MFLCMEIIHVLHLVSKWLDCDHSLFGGNLDAYIIIWICAGKKEVCLNITKIRIVQVEITCRQKKMVFKVFKNSISLKSLFMIGF